MSVEVNHEESKVISEEVLKLAIRYRRENPLRSIRDLIMILEMEGIVKSRFRSFLGSNNIYIIFKEF